MRSRADRERVEWLLRSAALALLVVAFVRLILAGLETGAPAVHRRAEGGLEASERDLLRALARSGARVSWSGAVAALAVTSEPVRDPSARTRIAVVGEGAALLADSLGALDSLASGGGTLTAAGLAGSVVVAARAPSAPRTSAGAVPEGTASTTITHARTLPGASAEVGRVLVLGEVGWESKFTIAALEEAGWTVDARLRLSDTLVVTQGGAGAPALTTHSAVVVLDTAVGAQAAAVMRFVRSGGGLVLSGDGVAAPAFASVAPARAGMPEEGERDAFERDEPRHALPFRPLTSLREDAVVLERRDAAIAVVARRVASGRVVQSGYGETWRWRMQAERDGPAAHRRSWEALVATVAAARPPIADLTSRTEVRDEAPLATLIHSLGPSAGDAPTSGSTPSPLPAWWGAIALLLLLAEWASRRARGVA